VKDYFKLQFKITNRRLRDSGLKPVIGYVLLFAVFTGLSLFLFDKTEFAEYIYVLIALALSSQLSEKRRNDFLKICFGERGYRITRITENLVVSFPFVVFLIYQNHFISPVVLLTLNLLLALTNPGTRLDFTMPTPFYRKPFEFTVGFRNTFYLFPVSYLLTAIAVATNNFNLGVFSFLFINLITLSYYVKPEGEYYVWSFAMSPQSFIKEKIKTAIVYSSILCLPVFIALSVYFFRELETIVWFYFIGLAFLITVILAKYSAYPFEMNLPQGILIALCIYLPPLLLAVVPFFYFQSVKHLKQYLV